LEEWSTITALRYDNEGTRAEDGSRKTDISALYAAQDEEKQGSR